jgi:hypothetical protein
MAVMNAVGSFFLHYYGFLIDTFSMAALALMGGVSVEALG